MPPSPHTHGARSNAPGCQAALREHVQAALPDRLSLILLIGCGDSPLSAEMARSGYVNLVSCDISPVVVARQRRRHPRLRWCRVDATRMSGFDADSFDAVIDKSLLDVFLMLPTAALAVGKATAMLREVRRVLKPGGKYLCSSLFQRHMLLPVWFAASVASAPPPAPFGGSPGHGDCGRPHHQRRRCPSSQQLTQRRSRPTHLPKTKEAYAALARAHGWAAVREREVPAAQHTNGGRPSLLLVCDT